MFSHEYLYSRILVSRHVFVSHLQSESRKKLLSGMLMTAADVAAIAKPWELQHETAKQVADEFFDQGDMERMQLGINPMWMMDRERKDELPQMQVRMRDNRVLFVVVLCSAPSSPQPVVQSRRRPLLGPSPG